MNDSATSVADQAQQLPHPACEPTFPIIVQLDQCVLESKSTGKLFIGAFAFEDNRVLLSLMVPHTFWTSLKVLNCVGFSACHPASAVLTTAEMSTNSLAVAAAAKARRVDFIL